MMEAKLDSTDVNEKMSDGSDNNSQTTASKFPNSPDNCTAGPTGMRNKLPPTFAPLPNPAFLNQS